MTTRPTRRSERILAAVGAISLAIGIAGLLAVLGPALDARALLDSEADAAQLTADLAADITTSAAEPRGASPTP